MTADHSPWYLRGGIGPEYTLHSALTLDASQPDARVKFDAGFRADVGAGYQFTPYFGVEGDTGMIYSHIHSVAGSTDVEASFDQYPFLVNAVFQLPNASHWIPFAGGGCGVNISGIDIGHATVQDNQLHGNAAAATFAYQAFGGVRYDFNPRWNVTLSYEFLGTTRPEWDVNYTDTGAKGTLAMRAPYAHAVVAALVYRF